ncbi:A disintegrin and metalloproteinase with thrombospondin motifs 7-like [Aricia agestis]|uniref:A disintegrin and metalloproteinase with thrombospondin motifs 7-like n=1 Tax=Aricia agestis TaxID=91739 RepID=UPI001C20AA64|nr:A disintegrin and metalloproteinase with thrombospondin motifs 7-like [Aricia agestis]
MVRLKSYTVLKNFLWLTTTMNIIMVTAANFTTVFPEIPEYAWSGWSSWSPCSRSCGGGVSVQERHCLPRNSANGTVPGVRVSRQTHECVGIDKRYQECNTKPCIVGEGDMRAAQCSLYDRRPFRGRFYTWVPYVDGASPCMLNCRPLGQHFYASLSLVADGTPCTSPGHRAICIQGTCQIVGRESVLGVSEARCGRRLVSGLFARPRLPLGYSYVTTVPRGACGLNVSEIVSSDNYIALKISNGSYIVNGEFAISAPGSYEAAGARFIYSREAGQDVVTAHGPILQPVDIMILYTQPGPSIKYEFFTESLPGELNDDTTAIPETTTTKHIRRHHDRHLNFESLTKDSKNRIEDTGPRKFMWKILSYGQCTRTCGGGIQIGKYRCVETSLSGDREVSSAHCYGSPPTSRRRRCGNIQCPPRWRTAAWSTCPQCGPATRTRIVGCVQDHMRGITKISDAKCPAPKPTTTEACNIPNCAHIAVRPAERQNDQTDHFRDGPVYTVALNSTDFDIGPEYSLSAGGWQYTNWSECVGWCVGGGVQSRSVRCADPAGCSGRPAATRNCTPRAKCDPHEGHWFTGDWSPCTTTCDGRQIRGVLCIGDTGRHLRDAACKAPKPEHERTCGGECTPTWYTSDWGQCTCTNGTGLQRRSVVCARADGQEPHCAETRPDDVRTCTAVCTGIPPDLTIESQKKATEVPTTTSSTTTTTEKQNTGCEDKLPNCALAVQARLCHYKYYIHNCCDSCRL